MIPQGPDACVFEDAIDYELPLGALGQLPGKPFVRLTLKRLFAYRHAVSRRAGARA
jgi:ligand-binding SRPBCC domain-containing protein